ncbi:carbohydrate kinase family protein [Amnibacterium kyonggiense]|uniref:Sugar/nucleoside kinase (Ribokinase family) n=1 Tax=Amnibacterium kyonggiense TaxID=595671 RepID=A0A4R7FFS4_9MICO|nr:PfkB family carbohydrate kinase [Amnibacterium kyonggiense]TDS75720.1 sugar/nucleoside kinase (ribokinase family) [Amnibacterium kyonggiense]
MPGVLAVGDVIDDVLVRPSGPIAPDTDTPSRIERTAGGSAANTACWLASIGVRTALVASVGDEDLQRHADLLEAAGVAPHLKASERSTGSIVVVSQGESRAMLTDRGANEDTAPEDVTDALLAEHDLLHVTGHVFAGPDRDAGWRDLFARAARAGVTTSVAPGSAGHLAAMGPDRFLRVVAGVDLLIAGLEEAQLLTGLADPTGAALALAAAHPLVVVTLGSDGSLVATRDGATPVPPVAAEVVDVTGAGDAYAAGFLAALAVGASDAEAGARAAALAALAVARVGARP